MKSPIQMHNTNTQPELEWEDLHETTHIKVQKTRPRMFCYNCPLLRIKTASPFLHDTMLGWFPSKRLAV